MILSERQREIKETIDNLKRQIELLDSHKLVGLINDKQYKESMYYISKKVDELEEELGVNKHSYNAFDLMFGKSIEQYNKLFGIHTEDSIEELLDESSSNS